MLLGPNYIENPALDDKRLQLQEGDLDEQYWYLYVPVDVQTFGAQNASDMNTSKHNYSGDNS